MPGVDEEPIAPTIHNLLHKDPNHANMCYDPHNVQAMITVDLKDGDDGHVCGSTFIPGSRFAQMMGQADPDTVRLQTIQAIGATTTFGKAMGAHFHYGKRGDNEVPMQTFDRVTHVIPTAEGEGNVITTHFTVPASRKAGESTSHYPAAGLGDVKLVNTFGSKEDHQVGTARAFQRGLRWSHALDKTPEELAATCTKVGSEGTARFLVPVDGAAKSCPMSSLIRSNVERNGADFCGGNYADGKRTVVANNRGEQCTVMASKDFHQVFSQLNENLKPKSEARNGVTLQVKSLLPARVGQQEPTVQLHTVFNRMTTAEVMDVEHRPLIEKAAAMEMLGEKPESGYVFSSSNPSQQEVLAERVFAMPLPGEDDTVGHALSKPGAIAEMSVQGVGADDHLGNSAAP